MLLKYCLLGLSILTLQACVVLAVADLAATTVVKTAGLVVDGTVGAVKMVGSAITPSSRDIQDKSKDKDPKK